MVGWLDSERPAGRTERWWKDGPVKPRKPLLMCEGTVAGSSVCVPQCCLLCQTLCESGSTPEHFFPHNNLWLHQSNIALSSLPLWSPSDCFIFSYPVSIFHSICSEDYRARQVICPSHLHTKLHGNKSFTHILLQIWLQWKPIYADEIFCVFLSTLTQTRRLP